MLLLYKLKLLNILLFLDNCEIELGNNHFTLKMVKIGQNETKALIINHAGSDVVKTFLNPNILSSTKEFFNFLTRMGNSFTIKLTKGVLSKVTDLEKELSDLEQLLEEIIQIENRANEYLNKN